jgi:glycosyltransferase involved in cell wall biosynthesis
LQRQFAAGNDIAKYKFTLTFAGMKIVVNTRSLFKVEVQDGSYFGYECFKRIAAFNPTHEFVFICDRSFEQEFIAQKNITSLIIETPIKTSIAWQFWHNYKLPALLKKYKADVLVNVNGFCSLRTKIPQSLVVRDLIFLHYPEFVSKNHLSIYKKTTPLSLSKAKKIITISQSAKEELIKKYKINDKKIDAVYNGINEMYKPIDWKEKELIKEKYSENKEFFLYSGAVEKINNVMALVKAFSFFKKRQKSNMQLLIASNSSLQFQYLAESLKTYKYRTDVKMLENLPVKELAKITATAYSFITPALFENSGDSLLQAMKCNVPVIASNISIFNEIAADAALYADQNNFENIADKIMLIFKDEKKRDELIEKGKRQVQLFNWDKTANLLWKAIQETVQL